MKWLRPTLPHRLRGNLIYLSESSGHALGSMKSALSVYLFIFKFTFCFYPEYYIQFSNSEINLTAL